MSLVVFTTAVGGMIGESSVSAAEGPQLERGRYLRLRLDTALNSKKVAVGDAVKASLVAPVSSTRVLPLGRRVELEEDTVYRAQTSVTSRIEMPVDLGMVAVGWLNLIAGQEFTVDKADLDVRVIQVKPQSPATAAVEVVEGELAESRELLPAKTRFDGQVVAVGPSPDGGGDWIEVEFDRLRTPGEKEISIGAKVVAGESKRLEGDPEDAGRWVLAGSGEQARVVRMDGEVRLPPGPAKLGKGTEFGLVLLELVDLSR